MYQLIADDGPAHEWVFETEVTAREYSTTGKGFCFFANSKLTIHITEPTIPQQNSSDCDIFLPMPTRLK